MKQKLECGGTDAYSACLNHAEPHGRRIYIQEASLATLAKRSATAEFIVHEMLSKVLMLKVLRHRVEDASLLGTTGYARAEAFVDAAEAAWADAASAALFQIGIRDREGSVTPVLNRDEHVSATCYYSNYFTFATGEEAARRMFVDRNDIATIKRLMRSGEDYADMTLVSGDCLELVTTASTPKEMENDRKDELKKKLVQELTTMALGALPNPSASETELLHGLKSAAESVFTRSILR